MKKDFFWVLLMLFCFTGAVTSCSEDSSDDDNEYENWQERNDAYFASIRANALDSIRQAKTLYGNSWTDHCNWRTYLSYSLDSTIANNSTDSIYVEILRKGTGSGCPLSTDSCRIYYRGRLIPSATYPEGNIFDHTGQFTTFDLIFNSKTAVPTLMRPTYAVKGFGTALQNMHIGDLWKVYIPYALGYSTSNTTTIPAYSTLIFEIELIAYYRSGSNVPSWN